MPRQDCLQYLPADSPEAIDSYANHMTSLVVVDTVFMSDHQIAARLQSLVKLGVMQGNGAQICHRLKKPDLLFTKFAYLIRVDPEDTHSLLFPPEGNDQHRFYSLHPCRAAVLKALIRPGILQPDRLPLQGLLVQAAFFQKDRPFPDVSPGKSVRGSHHKHIFARIEETETGGKPAMKAARITPEMAGLTRATLDQFIGGDVKTNAALLYDVLTGIPGARRDIVLLNAAAGLVAAGMAGDLKEGVKLGAEAIDSGEAAATLAKLRQFAAKHRQA